MARKRTFAEIIDLTQHVSDEDDPYQHVQRSRLETINPNVVSDTFVKPSNGHDAMKNQHLKPLLEIPERDSRSEVNSAPVTDEEMFKYAPLQRDLLQSESIVRPMNKRNALRRDNYNAKTIARDILVASGKHPTMAPLNYHLKILRKKFRHVDNDSDLTTFRWDLVDPNEPTKKIADDFMNDADDESATEAYPGGQLLLPRQAQMATADGDDVVMIGQRDFSVLLS